MKLGIVFFTVALACPMWSLAQGLDATTIDGALGRSGQNSGDVYRVSFPRTDLHVTFPRAETITDHGMTLTPAQGIAEAINFLEAGSGKVATTGDFVLTAEEVNPAISALADHDIQITALQDHMLTEEPRLFFMHFWAVGDTESVAQGIKAALSNAK